MSEKVIGYLLLAGGLLLILFSTLNIYLTFTGRALPVMLFHTSGISLDLSQSLPVPNPAAKPVEIFSAADMNQVADLTLTYLLDTFFVSVGAKIASLGVQLLRPVNIKLQARPV